MIRDTVVLVLGLEVPKIRLERSSESRHGDRRRCCYLMLPLFPMMRQQLLDRLGVCIDDKIRALGCEIGRESHEGPCEIELEADRIELAFDVEHHFGVSRWDTIDSAEFTLLSEENRYIALLWDPGLAAYVNTYMRLQHWLASEVNHSVAVRFGYAKDVTGARAEHECRRSVPSNVEERTRRALCTSGGSSTSSAACSYCS
jgi:hypothetical protein